jgi:hypothetical protein
MNAIAAEKSLRELAQEIAQALGSDWKLSTKFDAEDANDRRPWRSRIEGPNSQALFLSNTWGGKGMLHVAGWTPDGIDHNTQARVGQLPSINISLAKTSEQMAKDITRRLLPDYQAQLTKLFEQHRQDTDYKNGVEVLRKAVADVLDVPLRDTDTEVIRGKGNVDIQVSSPTSLRLHGHMLYVTLDQLKRIKKAVPELFERGAL